MKRTHALIKMLQLKGNNAFHYMFKISVIIRTFITLELKFFTLLKLACFCFLIVCLFWTIAAHDSPPLAIQSSALTTEPIVLILEICKIIVLFLFLCGPFWYAALKLDPMYIVTKNMFEHLFNLFLNKYRQNMVDIILHK